MLVFAVFCAVLVAKCASLSAGEESAFDALKRTYPALLNYTTWNLPSRQACSYEGVLCDEQNHVLWLYVAVFSVRFRVRSASPKPPSMAIANLLQIVDRRTRS